MGTDFFTSSQLAFMILYGVPCIIALWLTGLLKPLLKFGLVVIGLYVVAVFSHAVHVAPACVHISAGSCY